MRMRCTCAVSVSTPTFSTPTFSEGLATAAICSSQRRGVIVWVRTPISAAPVGAPPGHAAAAPAMLQRTHTPVPGQRRLAALPLSQQKPRCLDARPYTTVGKHRPARKAALPLSGLGRHAGGRARAQARRALRPPACSKASPLLAAAQNTFQVQRLMLKAASWRGGRLLCMGSSGGTARLRTLIKQEGEPRGRHCNCCSRSLRAERASQRVCGALGTLTTAARLPLRANTKHRPLRPLTRRNFSPVRI